MLGSTPSVPIDIVVMTNIEIGTKGPIKTRIHHAFTTFRTFRGAPDLIILSSCIVKKIILLKFIRYKISYENKNKLTLLKKTYMTKIMRHS